MSGVGSKVRKGVWLLSLALTWLVHPFPGPPMLSGFPISKLDDGFLSPGSGICKHCKVSLVQILHMS